MRDVTALQEAVNDAVAVGATRTMQQDASYGLRQLADVALNAMAGHDGAIALAAEADRYDGFVAIYEDVTGTVCAAESQPIEVWTSLPASIEPIGPFCITSGPQLVQAASAPPFGVSWSGDIDSWNSSGATFIPTSPGTFTVVLHADPTSPFQCPGIDTLLITGYSTSGCVRAGAVDSLSRGYRTIVPEQCVADKHESYHFANLTDLMLKYADVVDVNETLAWLDQQAAAPRA